MKLATLSLIALLTACASTQQGPRTEPGGNVPLVQISNEHYSNAVIYLEGIRFAEVQGGGSSGPLPVSPSRISANGEVRFSARFPSTDEAIELPAIQYQPGRAMRIFLKPTLGASTAR